jgi:hypothetical protein
MRQGRKRSAAITLVLAGSLSGCSEPEAQRDVYRSLGDCQRDWNAPAQCQPADGQRHASSWFYGPPYYGSSYTSGRPRPSPAAVDAFHAGRGVAGTGGAAVARSGFGTTGRSFSSGS